MSLNDPACSYRVMGEQIHSPEFWGDKYQVGDLLGEMGDAIKPSLPIICWRGSVHWKVSL